MDELSHLDGDVESIIRSWGIAGFQYHDFGVAAARLPQMPASHDKEGQPETHEATQLAHQSQNVKTVPSKANRTTLSVMFKNLSLEA